MEITKYHFQSLKQELKAVLYKVVQKKIPIAFRQSGFKNSTLMPNTSN